MTDPVSLSQLFQTFGRIGVLSFGGPAAQISLMHSELVDRHRWLSEDQFLKALSFCMLLPGPEAMQLATYAGWRLKGVLGGLIAGLLFVLPGAAVIFALAYGYALYGDLPLVHAIFAGIQATVVVIVLQALWRLSRKALKTRASWVLAALAFVSLFFLSVPFPLIILAAGIFGFWSSAAQPAAPQSNTGEASLDQARDPQTVHPQTTRPHTTRTIATWGALWAAPVALLWALDHVFLTQIALFFSQLAVVTFGGAYAVLAYMTQAVVETHGWLTTPQMIDALGLAETTPGPLILVTQFVGFLAGQAHGGLALAVAAACLTLWVTFCPCFLWIFAGAPYVEDLLNRPRLTGALGAISASVVGVMLNLSLWFALHVIFANVRDGRFGPAVDLTTLVPIHVALIALAGFLLLVGRVNLIVSLAVMGAIGAALGQAGFFV